MVIERRGATLMTRREGPLMAGLWEPPSVERAGATGAGPALRRALARRGVRARLAATGAIVRHTVTHREFETELWRGDLIGASVRELEASPGSRRKSDGV